MAERKRWSQERGRVVSMNKVAQKAEAVMTCMHNQYERMPLRPSEAGGLRSPCYLLRSWNGSV